MSKYIETTITYDVIVQIEDDAPDDVISRGESPIWADQFYGKMDWTDVLEHWAFNAVTNGIDDVSRLDGWADVQPGAVTFQVQP